MRLLTTALFLSLSSLTAAAPASLEAAGSRKNVYLATCTPRAGDGCLLGILCSRDSTSPSSSSAAEAALSYSAVIYYNGPASSRTSPTDVGTVSTPARAWEGATRKAVLSAGAFEGTIDAGAAQLSKSSIAGSAMLGREEFVCFRDGEATFQFEEGLLVSRSVSCKADYWCASIAV
ncbi:Nn.00g018690.m01.CDS01 [Neocucurbitaria sp. VM-36]